MENAQLIFTSQFSITTGAWNSIPFIRRVTIWGYSECVHDSPSRQMSVVQYQTAARTDNAAARGQQFTDGSEETDRGAVIGCIFWHWRRDELKQVKCRRKTRREIVHTFLSFSLFWQMAYTLPPAHLFIKIFYVKFLTLPRVSLKKRVIKRAFWEIHAWPHFFFCRREQCWWFFFFFFFFVLSVIRLSFKRSRRSWMNGLTRGPFYIPFWTCLIKRKGKWRPRVILLSRQSRQAPNRTHGLLWQKRTCASPLVVNVLVLLLNTFAHVSLADCCYSRNKREISSSSFS